MTEAEQLRHMCRAHTEVEQERDEAQRLLHECYAALCEACGSEDGLDCAQGVPLIHRIEALLPAVRTADPKRWRQEYAVRSYRERGEARSVALAMLKIVETYLRLDVAAPKRIRDEAAAAREKVKEWEENR